MKKKKIVWITLLIVTFTLVSCIKDEAKNKECDILKAWVQSDEYASYFSDQNLMHKDNISSIENEITFTVRLGALQHLSHVPVYFEITSGATIEPANGSAQDFTAGPVTYTVTSEDGAWTRQYKVSFVEPSFPTFKFGFENVEVFDNVLTKSQYHIFYDFDESGQRQNFWSTPNPGAAVTLGFSHQPEDFPTYSVEDGYVGKGVCLETISTGLMGQQLKKPFSPGTIYFGKFILENLITNTTRTTQFGIRVTREPLRVTGYYKYTPGEKFIDKDSKEIVGRIDEGCIYALFYKNKDAQGKDYYIYAGDVVDQSRLGTIDNVYRYARIEKVISTDKWTYFEMYFDGLDVDPQEVADGAFNMALVFASSKDGSFFEGAVGSKLYIDEVEVTFKN